MHVWVCALTCRCVHVPRTCAAVLGPFSRLAHLPHALVKVGVLMFFYIFFLFAAAAAWPVLCTARLHTTCLTAGLDSSPPGSLLSCGAAGECAITNVPQFSP